MLLVLIPSNLVQLEVTIPMYIFQNKFLSDTFSLDIFSQRYVSCFVTNKQSYLRTVDQLFY
jgi:hypothetical protein